MLERQLTSAKTGAAPALMEQLGKSVNADGAKMASKVKVGKRAMHNQTRILARLCSETFCESDQSPLLEALLNQTILHSSAADRYIGLQGMILFKIDDSDWTLDLREGTEGELYQVCWFS